MSFNGSGSYSLPAGNPVTANSTISSTVHNNTMSDIASALSNVICKDGQTTITANIPMSSYKLTGLAAGSANGNSLRYEQLFTTGTVTMLGPLAVVDGTVTAPGLRFSSSSTTGIFSSSDNTVRFTCNDSTEGVFSSAGLQLTHALNLSASTSGQIQFPATQNASANANTLDDYEEGTWTPVLSFATPGDVSITLSTTVGAYRKIGSQVIATADAVSSSFTHTTASGNFQISGSPFTSANTSGQTHSGAGSFNGITKTGYGTFSARMAANSTVFLIGASGSGVSVSNVEAADMPSGGSLQIRFSIPFNV